MNENGKIVYVMSRPHSGSTVFDALLGNGEGIFGVGELVSGWNRLDKFCGCGSLLRDCCKWKKIREIYSSHSTLTWEKSGLYTKKNTRITNLVKHAIFHDEKLYKITHDCFQSIFESGDHDCVVDSSKEFSRALFLLKNFQNAKVVFLVRRVDSVVNSYTKRLDDGTGFRFMRIRIQQKQLKFLWILLAAFTWLIGNVIGELIRMKYGSRVLLVRYEDLCENTESELLRVGRFINENLDTVIEAVKIGENLEIGHKIAGNRMRDAGTFTFGGHVDEGKKLPFLQRKIVLFIGFFVMKKFKYN